jgi:Bacterial Ig domain
MSRSLTFSLVLLWVLSACNLSTEAPTAVPTADLPRIEFQQPINGATVIDGSELTIDLLATDERVGIVRIELLVDDVSYREGAPDNNTPVPTFRILFNWLAQGIGRHTLTAVAYRPDGTPSDELTILVEVLPRASATP